MAPKRNTAKAIPSTAARNTGHRPVTRSQDSSLNKGTTHEIQKKDLKRQKAIPKAIKTGTRQREKISEVTKGKLEKKANRKEETPATKEHSEPADDNPRKKPRKKEAKLPRSKANKEIVDSKSKEDVVVTKPDNGIEENGKFGSNSKDAKASQTTRDPGKDQSPPRSPKRKRSTEPTVTAGEDVAPRKKSPKVDKSLPQQIGNIVPRNPIQPASTVQEIKDLKAFAAEGWDINGLPAKIDCVDDVPLSRFPSPFASLGGQEDHFMHVVDIHTHPSIQVLFDHLRNNRNNINDGSTCRREIEDFEHFDDDSSGIFCRLEENLSDEVERDKTRISFTLHTPPPTGDQLVITLDSRERREYPNQSTDNDFTKRLYVYRRENTETGQVGHFVANVNFELFVTNEKVIGKDLLAGPLPEFAVIRIDQFALFWWARRRALDYLPLKVSDETEKLGAVTNRDDTNRGNPNRDDTKTDTSHGIVGDEDATNSAFPSMQTTTWRDILYGGLARHRRARKRDRKKDAHSIAMRGDHYAMHTQDVLLGVASIWSALRHQQVLFAFAGEEIFDENLRTTFRRGLLNPNFGVVGGGNTFIMPISFRDAEATGDATTWKQNKPNDVGKPSKMSTSNKMLKDGDENHNKGEGKGTAPDEEREVQEEEFLGHFVLAVAQRRSQDSNDIDVKTYDTRPGTVRESSIRESAQKIATTFGWITGCDESNKPRPLLDESSNPVVPEFEDISVPCQPRGSNACGLYVILFAWAHILGIPLHRDRKRRTNSSSSAQALQDGLDIVNLALAGHMNARTIQAYLNFYGYSTAQDPNSHDHHVVHNVVAHKMNEAKFKSILENQIQMDQPGAPPGGIPLESSTPPISPLTKESGTAMPQDPGGSSTHHVSDTVQPDTGVSDEDMQRMVELASPGTSPTLLAQYYADAGGDLEVVRGIMQSLRKSSPS